MAAPLLKFVTAHGPLSFQPADTADGPVTVQYRGAGAPQTGQTWEQVSVEGLEEWLIAFLAAHQPTPTPPPDVGADADWLGIPPSMSAEYVAAVKSALLADGKDLSGPCGAFTIVENVAYGLRETGCGTFFKDYGNMCRDRSTDVVCYKDVANGVAIIVDILGDAGGQNTPSWLVKDDAPEDINRWCPAELPQ
jgi:hypothetical protein